MKKWTVPACIAMSIAAAAQPGASPDAPLAFEVASIKLHPPPRNGMFFFRSASGTPFKISGSNVIDGMVTLEDLVMHAYNLKDYQVSGIPEWGKGANGNRYDIQAKAPGDAPPTTQQVRLMMQSLLAERFQLKAHRETKELPVYDLVVGKNGSKLKEPPPNAPPLDVKSHIMRSDMIPLVNLIALYARDRPVIDKTNLTGTYEYPTDWFAAALPRNDGEPPASIFTLLPENLGLQLVPSKAPVEILVIDRVEKPSEN